MSDWVVFYTNSTVEKKSYCFYHHAKAFADKENAKRDNAECYSVYHRNFYNEYVVHDVRVQNIMSKKWITEKSNTPYYCSPSSETYRSM